MSWNILPGLVVSSQQSMSCTASGLQSLQLSLPQTRVPVQSLSRSQSPWPTGQVLLEVQQPESSCRGSHLSGEKKYDKQLCEQIFYIKFLVYLVKRPLITSNFRKM